MYSELSILFEIPIPSGTRGREQKERTVGHEQEKSVRLSEDQLEFNLSGGNGVKGSKRPETPYGEDGIDRDNLSDHTFFGASCDPTCMRRGLGMYPSSREHSD